MLKKLGLGAGILAGCFVACANEAKNTYVVDMAKVYDNFYKTKPAQEKFQMLAKQAQDSMGKMMEEGKKLFDEREALIKKRNNPANSESINKDLEEKIKICEGKIDKKGEEVNRFRQEQDEKLEQQRQAILSEHFKEINAGIEALAKQKNADLVLNKAGVLYSKPEFDITDEVIKNVNKPANNKQAKDGNKTKGKEENKGSIKGDNKVSEKTPEKSIKK